MYIKSNVLNRSTDDDRIDTGTLHRINKNADCGKKVAMLRSTLISTLCLGRDLLVASIFVGWNC